VPKYNPVAEKSIQFFENLLTFLLARKMTKLQHFPFTFLLVRKTAEMPKLFLRKMRRKHGENSTVFVNAK
jgi:hypothetical protein